ncbi:MAG: hypothetical protein JNL08_00495 [Planctomycetes bacterium]|nr:hypothetical protein [Planctomycetota bacterium]
MTTGTDHGPPPALLLRGVDPALLGHLVRRHREAGGTVEGLAEVAPPAPPPRGADEPGKGSLVDVVA